ncbi:MAG: type II toxin-antitoxin system HicA family toxin [Oceanipulchritudo sp.]|jgi:predicted RNA binding protein YcfA (HicA-like mRNA interferase family)
MSPKAPRLTGRQLIKLLGKRGFETSRIRGSHHFLKHPDGRATVVPVHRGEIIGPGLLAKILRDTELTIKDL